jgi:signal transduction histidine kinase
MNLLPRPLRNSLTLKVTLLCTFTGMIAISAVGYFRFLKLEEKVQGEVAARLERVAKSASRFIDTDAHAKVVQDYLDKNPSSATSPEFLKLQIVLKRMREALEPNAEVYTFIRPEWKLDTMIFIAMDGEKPYIGNGVALSPEAEKALDPGRVTHTKLTRDREGNWMSAYAPVRDADGGVIGGLGVDYRADPDLKAAGEAFTFDFIPEAGIFLLLTMAGGWWLGRRISRRARQASMVAVGYTQGNFETRPKTKSQDELGLLYANVIVLGAEIEKSQKTEKDYAKNLERVLEQKELQLEKLEGSLRPFVDALRVPVISFGKDGKCLSSYSQAAHEIFGKRPEGMPVWDLMGFSSAEWSPMLAGLFESVESFPEAASRCPVWYRHDSGRIYLLDYAPVLSGGDEKKEVSAVLLTALDYTGELSAQAEAEREREKLQGIHALYRNRGGFVYFVVKTREILRAAKTIRPNEAGKLPDSREVVRSFVGLVETANMYGLATLAERLRRYLDELVRMTNVGPAEARALAVVVEDLAEQTESSLETWAQELMEITGDAFELPGTIRWNHVTDVESAINTLEGHPDIQRTLSSLLLCDPLSQYLKVYRDTVANLATRESKDISPLQFGEEDPRIKGEYLQELFDSLINVFTASVRLMESPSDRQASGKPRHGKITLTSSVTETTPDEPSWLSLCIEDDGRGFDPMEMRAELARQAPELDVVSESDHEIVQRVFDENFSVALWQTLAPGVAETNLPNLASTRLAVQKLGGVIEVSSKTGSGSLFVILVPLPYTVSGSDLLKNAA